MWHIRQAWAMRIGRGHQYTSRRDILQREMSDEWTGWNILMHTRSRYYIIVRHGGRSSGILSYFDIYRRLGR